MQAIETVDACLGDVVRRSGQGGALIVTADHGNAEKMLEPDGRPHTAHTLNPVPLIVTADVGPLRDGGVWPTWRRPCSPCSGASSPMR